MKGARNMIRFKKRGKWSEARGGAAGPRGTLAMDPSLAHAAVFRTSRSRRVLCLTRTGWGPKWGIEITAQQATERGGGGDPRSKTDMEAIAGVLASMFKDLVCCKRGWERSVSRGELLQGRRGLLVGRSNSLSWWDADGRVCKPTRI